jgi:hypothetical protein
MCVHMSLMNASWSGWAGGPPVNLSARLTVPAISAACAAAQSTGMSVGRLEPGSMLKHVPVGHTFD